MPSIEQIEYLPVGRDGADEDAAVESGQRRRASPVTVVAAALLAVLCAIGAVGLVRLQVLVDRTESLIVEQQRTTCYERLQWLGDSFDAHPEGADLRVGASRQCEGDEPLVEFKSE